jgi:DNA-binding transcriptional LysR family regulator
MFDWNDLRHFLAVARNGTTLAAARDLGTSQSTVVRRIAALEGEVGAPLFERNRTGYTPTEAGREILPMVERVETQAQALADGIAAHCRHLAGHIRVTAAESVANILLAPAVCAFYESHPGVEIQLLIDDRYLDLERGEADIAIRATTKRGLDDCSLPATLLSESPWSIYCSRSYAERAGLPTGLDQLAGHAIVVGEGAIADFPALRLIEEAAPQARIAWRSSSLTNLHAAVVAGVGVSALPALLGSRDPSLVRCFGTGKHGRAEIWLVARDEIRQLPHVRAFIAALTAYFGEHRAAIRGEAADAD